MDSSVIPRAYRRTCSTESRAGSTEMKIGLTKRRGDDSGNDFSVGQVLNGVKLWAR